MDTAVFVPSGMMAEDEFPGYSKALGAEKTMIKELTKKKVEAQN